MDEIKEAAPIPKKIKVGSGKVIRIGKQPKRRRTNKEILRPGQWYKMVSLFDGAAKKVFDLGGEGVVMQGMIPPRNETVACLVPTSVTQEQGVAMQRFLEGVFGFPVLLLTNNTQLVRLKAVSDEYAKTVIDGSAAEVLQFVDESKEAVRDQANPDWEKIAADIPPPVDGDSE